MIPVSPTPRGYPSALEEDRWLTQGVLIRRLAAFVVDGALIALALSVAWTACLLFGLLTLGLGWPVFGVLPAVPLLYHWLFVWGFAATPGQALLGITVRRDADLGPPDIAEALVFTLLFYLTMALGAVWFALALLTPRHRAAHDLASGLVVVRTRALTPAAGSWNMRFGAVPPGGPTAA